jgi:hypothetical protein
MKNVNFGQVYQNLIVTLMFAFLFYNASPTQRNEMIKITMNAMDSANQIVIKVQSDSTTALDTLKFPGIDSTRNDSAAVDTKE